MGVNTNYGIRPVTTDEIVATFGSARYARECCGRDQSMLLFYVHNRDRVPPDKLLAKVLYAYHTAPRRGRKKDKPPSFAAVARLANMNWRTVKKLLKEAGVIS